tara:strand:- start:313 stop:516 length:204 start_codon:yes stop_codon:yes gene_type:complete
MRPNSEIINSLKQQASVLVGAIVDGEIDGDTIGNSNGINIRITIATSSNSLIININNYLLLSLYFFL